MNIPSGIRVNIILAIIISFCVSLQISRLALSQESVVTRTSQDSATVVKQLLADKDIKTGEPKVIVEWNKVWGALSDKEAKELKAQGLSDEKIIDKLNPEAAKRVAKKLGVEKLEDVQKAVDEYFTALAKAKSQSR